MKKLLLLVLPLFVACATTVRTSDDDATLARDVFDLTFPASARPASDANFSGIRTDDLLFSRRTDSRTYFVQDRRVTPNFAGSDARLVEIATGVLKRAGIPRAEIVAPRVIQEQLQAVNIDRAARTVLRREAVTKGMRVAHVSRQVGKVPVFTSRLVLTVDASERPSFAELHWPEVPSAVVAEAERLQRVVAGGWKPPQDSRMRAENVEAGIVHSPAASLVMDFAPVIRVIYASENGGKKPMLFYDRNGRLVAPPRTFPAMPALKKIERPKAAFKP